MAVFGTRPEVIKLSPVIREVRHRMGGNSLLVCSTGQHREMLHQAMAVFDISPDIELAVMRDQQALPDLTSRLIDTLSKTFVEHRPDIVIVQGDTTTAFAAALSAFYQNIPVAHVEAGLRTGHLESPFPEELNRTMIARMARWNFAPTLKALQNLLSEGVHSSTIHVVGNTVVDAIAIIRKQWENDNEKGALPIVLSGRGMVLITTHRRENLGDVLERICLAIRILCVEYPDLEFVFPVHLNPLVRKVVFKHLDGVENLRLIEPVDFSTSLRFQSLSRLIITDSGGIQEEAPSFFVPVVVMREYTERSEGITAGFAALTGTETESIVNASRTYLKDSRIKETLSVLQNPYGDGKASSRIVATLLGEPMESFRG